MTRKIKRLRLRTSLLWHGFKRKTVNNIKMDGSYTEEWKGPLGMVVVHWNPYEPR